MIKYLDISKCLLHPNEFEIIRLNWIFFKNVPLFVSFKSKGYFFCSNLNVSLFEREHLLTVPFPTLSCLGTRKVYWKIACLFSKVLLFGIKRHCHAKNTSFSVYNTTLEKLKPRMVNQHTEQNAAEFCLNRTLVWLKESWLMENIPSYWSDFLMSNGNIFA